MFGVAILVVFECLSLHRIFIIEVLGQVFIFLFLNEAFDDRLSHLLRQHLFVVLSKLLYLWITLYLDLLRLKLSLLSI